MHVVPDDGPHVVPDDGPLILGDRALTPEDVVAIAVGRRVELGASARAEMVASREVIERVLARKGLAILTVDSGQRVDALAAALPDRSHFS
jgi:hypothetical protein